jgi:hypothetical protein
MLFTVSMTLGMLLSMYVILGPQIHAIDELHTKYGNAFQVAHNMNTIEQKVSFLVDATIMRAQGEAVSIMPIVQIVGGLLACWIAFVLLSARKKSFISINAHSIRCLEKYGKRYEFIRNGLLLTLVLGIVSALMGAKLYDLIKGV